MKLNLKPKKFYISKSLEGALEKQRSNLLVTTAASAVGYIFVVAVQLITTTDIDPESEVDWEAAKELKLEFPADES